mmetsp:Transcript_55391/g.135856  ORF Transcript_55391/g.135856 Transcript_55391/m.135856 type:complete len:213 (+) Transcript_55391:2705-3343(+)
MTNNKGMPESVLVPTSSPSACFLVKYRAVGLLDKFLSQRIHRENVGLFPQAVVVKAVASNSIICQLPLAHHEGPVALSLRHMTERAKASTERIRKWMVLAPPPRFRGVLPSHQHSSCWSANGVAPRSSKADSLPSCFGEPKGVHGPTAEAKVCERNVIGHPQDYVRLLANGFVGECQPNAGDGDKEKDQHLGRHGWRLYVASPALVVIHDLV